ncbi:MAG TPA: HAMP domain-containing sensor histidine kinase [Vicinamibacterales bacterium]
MASVLRILRAGVVASIAVGLFGWGAERLHFGASDAATLARVQNQIRDRLDSAADNLAAIAGRLVVAPETVRLAARDPAVTRALFDEVSTVLREQEPGRTGITIYGSDGAAVAWGGRVFDVPRERLSGASAWFVASGAIGPRLVHIEPIRDRSPAGRSAAPAAVVIEYSLPAVSGAQPGSFVLDTSIAPVLVRPSLGVAAPPARPFSFLVSTRSGAITAEAEISPADLAAERAHWRAATWAAALAILGIAVLLCARPLLELRLGAGDFRTYLTYTLLLAALCLGSLVLFLSATRSMTRSPTVASPGGLLLIALAALALAVMGLDLVERRRLSRQRNRLRIQQVAVGVGVRYFVVGVAAAGALAAYEVLLRRVVASTSLEVLHFSLHPVEWSRLAVAFALVAMHAAAIWIAVALTRAAAAFFRTPRSPRIRAVAVGTWILGAAIVVAAVAVPWDLPVVPLGVAVTAAGACAFALARIERQVRRGTQAARLVAFFLALLAPALAIYPSLVAFALDAKQRLVADVYGQQALSQREDLQRRLQRAIDQIDAIPSLPDYLTPSDSTPASDRAFVVWSRTDLATYRLTSAVELYGPTGTLVSRFALHLPEYEYAPANLRPPTCSWETLFDEVSPFGSSERHVLRTSRGICDRGRILGTIVVRVMLDYRTLPFVSTQSPYLASLQDEREERTETASGGDVEFAMYGWSRAPIIESRTAVWTLPDRVFNRLVATRTPFWDTLERDGDVFRVYFLSDRGEIYALGYPVISWLGHIINLAELALLVMVVYGGLLAAATIGAPRTARRLLREIRSSFYRKLFLAFVAGAVVPVVILAVAIRTYFANELTAGGVDAAQRTVTTAQRLVEDYAAIQQPAPLPLSALDDQIMVLVWRAIDEDVNLFDRARVQATSARDLFASQLLSSRTPGDVYKSILLDRSPTFVGDEQIGDHPYRLAAAPVRAGGREGIVTVPLTNRREEIESQIDELDRRVRSAAVLFIFLGAGIGYWMAERIADPVSRLTRATRRIARGDLTARIAATSSDELRRLVQDFNQMAADLQRQRAELERTQRLEAWADMARQVAHDIKNPLTPIQLSAEHARRVNADQGRPLSPVLDECVDAILTQVRLLRQISAEFSSFASSPTPRPVKTNVTDLVDEVVKPYRLGLSGRIAIDVESDASHLDAWIDQTLFARALTNVIENALHAMPGNGRLTISIAPDGRPPAAATNGRHITVQIADTGIGIDPEGLKRIFEPYFSTKAAGTGLGLTIAKRNVELNGGTIAVRSTKGVGTTVVLTIPMAP